MQYCKTSNFKIMHEGQRWQKIKATLKISVGWSSFNSVVLKSHVFAFFFEHVFVSIPIKPTLSKLWDYI